AMMGGPGRGEAMRGFAKRSAAATIVGLFLCLDASGAPWETADYLGRADGMARQTSSDGTSILYFTCDVIRLAPAETVLPPWSEVPVIVTIGGSTMEGVTYYIPSGDGHPIADYGFGVEESEFLEGMVPPARDDIVVEIAGKVLRFSSEGSAAAISASRATCETPTLFGIPLN
ncbi:MAG: hypothetical protein IT535_10200, partial [Bauldia sp.]|nr:hypothetical protein [Bauldia sp.]